MQKLLSLPLKMNSSLHDCEENSEHGKMPWFSDYLCMLPETTSGVAGQISQIELSKTFVSVIKCAICKNNPNPVDFKLPTNRCSISPQ